MFTIRAVERSLLFQLKPVCSTEFVYFVVSKYKGGKYFTKKNWAFQVALFYCNRKAEVSEIFDSVKCGRHEQNKILQ